MVEVVEVVVIGAGFGGLGAARELLRAGADVTVLERAAEVGGVWRDNTYPGAACDVPSPLYSWSWATNPDWSRRYSPQPEILDYLRRAADEAGLLGRVVTGSEVTEVRFDEAAGRWRVGTADGATYDADVVVSAVGQLSNPVVPALPGRDSFAGAMFHTARWRPDVDLRGKRVAVVGTGASSIQVVPAIVDMVGSLTVFQRSAPYVVGKPDRIYTALHHRLFRRFPGLLALERRTVFGLTELLNAGLTRDSAPSRALRSALRAAWRAQLWRQVPDRALRARLVPDYPIGCKRVLFSDDWYPALTREHVAVVSDAIAAVEPTGVRTADGRLHEADVLIWGTGFAATRFLTPIKVSGLGGADLHEVWAEGARAHLGITVPGFPNLFLVYGPNTNLGGSSVIAMMEAQARWIAQVVSRLSGPGQGLVAARPEVAEAYDREIQARLRRTAWSGCDSWYVDGSRVTTNWPGLVREYRDRLAEVDWDHLEVYPTPA